MSNESSPVLDDAAGSRRRCRIDAYLRTFRDKKEAPARAAAAEVFWEAWDASPISDVQLLFVFFDGWPVFIMRSTDANNSCQVEVRFDDAGAEVTSRSNGKSHATSTRFSDAQCTEAIAQMRARFCAAPST